MKTTLVVGDYDRYQSFVKTILSTTKGPISCNESHARIETLEMKYKFIEGPEVISWEADYLIILNYPSSTEQRELVNEAMKRLRL